MNVPPFPSGDVTVFEGIRKEGEEERGERGGRMRRIKEEGEVMKSRSSSSGG